MALNDNKKQYHPTTYSNYRMTNSEKAVDLTNLSFSYWNGSLRITIAPVIKGADGSISYDKENDITIYLNHTKARILHEEIKLFLTDTEKYSGSGVPSGSNIITISNGKEFGVEDYCLVIRKIDESGNVLSSYLYQFKHDYHYAIRNYNAEKSNSFLKATEDYKLLEIHQVCTLLEQYYVAMSSAVAYSVVDAMKYDMTRIGNKLDSISTKLGIPTGYNKNNNSSNSYFNKSFNDTSSFSESSLDDFD